MNLHQTISDAFVAQVNKNRGRVAVETKSEKISYADLNAVANRIANVLIDRSGPGAEPAILLLNQGASSVAATLAVIKAGKIYVPIDPQTSLRTKTCSRYDSSIALEFIAAKRYTN